jgi:hypothetical protein
MQLSPPEHGKRLGYGGTGRLGDAGNAGWKVRRQFAHPGDLGVVEARVDRVRLEQRTEERYLSYT